MMFQYRIIPQDNLIRITCKGDISIDELIDHASRVNADPDFREGMNTIADLNDARFELDFTQAEQFKNYVKEIEFSREKKSKWALYAPDPAACDPAALFKLILESDLIDVRIFSSRSEAEQWATSNAP